MVSKTKKKKVFTIVNCPGPEPVSAFCNHCSCSTHVRPTAFECACCRGSSTMTSVISFGCGEGTNSAALPRFHHSVGEATPANTLAPPPGAVNASSCWSPLLVLGAQPSCTCTRMKRRREPAHCLRTLSLGESKILADEWSPLCCAENLCENTNTV